MKKIISTILGFSLILGSLPTTGLAEGKRVTSTIRLPSSSSKTISEVKIEDLDAPYHGSELDKEITLPQELQAVSVKYTMFKKELDSFSQGDNINVVVRVKASDSSYKIASDSCAYWSEQDAYSDVTNIIGDDEAEYVFYYTVQAGDAPCVITAHFNIDVPKDGEVFPTEVTHPLSSGIKIKTVEWSPADETADASKEYTVRIEFDKEDNYVWADDFEDQAVVSVNGERTSLERVQKNKFFYYYTEAVIQPEKVDQEKPVVETAQFEIAVPKDGETLPTEVTHSLSPGIDVKAVKWSPADEKADATKEYTVTIEFNKECGYDWADDFEEQAVVSVNGKRTELKKKYDRTLKGTFNYYTQVTIQPTAKVNSGSTSNGGNSGSSSNGGNSSNKPSSSESYKFPFVDVTSDQWYYESVKAAHKMGLINGQSGTIYAPKSNMTFAEAIKLAVCMNILYNGGDPNTEIANGADLWYSTYMKYALDNGIIDEDLKPRANENITRKEYAYIFSKALPEKAFAAKNNIPSGSLPDIKEEKTEQDKAIYLLYRAGILAGNDAKGTFNPSANITRAEVATILIRMMEPTARVNAPAELGK